MQNYTTYFTRARKIPAGIVPISISLWPPRDWVGARMPQLAPTKSILQEYKATGDWERYVDRFQHEVLNKLDPSRIYEEIRDKSDGKAFALTCFEGSPAKCHRRLVAKWLNANLSNMPGFQPIREY